MSRLNAFFRSFFFLCFSFLPCLKQAWAIHTFSQQSQSQYNSAKYWYNTNTIQYNAISFSIDYNSSQYKNVYRMMQGYVWIVITIMKKMYMIYKMHKETFCFVRLLGNSLTLIHTIYVNFFFKFLICLFFFKNL